ncbi:BTAD domain-containing putative transcriptional regulator [Saccharothrix texasensis]|uniref:DNA-binding SARP family transcriptional activator n=1 Tax=Saccharothrix texasensis TaxID=103734 RepID=A0A3N1GZD2_9PSEU|nr:BTAD domain-containing putative transcriptional regulator [Saccharothrix texasensis]ROP35660.1 DNA-binding SARP family transcriptional activator [Saccharothrix texasensis]
MEFRLLGPLEVLHDGRPSSLGGIKQRATLGFLLLKANQVVPTSQLLCALWPGEDPPASARKMLQNAVWSLRAALSSSDGPGAPRLSTQAPGYVLQVDPARVDLFRFHELAERGRAEQGRPEVAAKVLREALATWRGAALADLVESGICWPELTVVENARLDAMEDYFDAELACGRHQSVLGELEAMVEAERLRERSCGQLMLALYRCGRHADALAVYSRLRTSLVDDLGLEPGPALQALQHAILTHDPSLALPAGRERAVVRHLRPVEPIPAPRTSSGAQRRRLTVALVRVRPRRGVTDADPAVVDHALAAATTMVRSGIEELGGTVATSIGSASLAVFGGPYSQGDDEARAVRAALALRDCFADGMSRDLAVHIAVATGEALVLTEPDAPPTVNGALVDHCHQVLSSVPEGAVWICRRTRELAGASFHGAETADGAWEITGCRGHADEHDSELAVVRGLLDRTLRRETPHLVTVLGEPDGFLDRFAGSVDGVRVLDSRVVDGEPLGAVADMLRRCCGARPEDGSDTVRARLAAAVCAAGRAEADVLATRLLPLFDPTSPDAGVLTAWRRFVELVARDHPLVVVLRDVHLAGEDVLDAVERLADSDNPVPLLVVVSARPSLLDRRPSWGGGKPHAASITLDPPRDGTVDRLRRVMLSTADDGPFGAGGADTWPRREPENATLALWRPDRRAAHVMALAGLPAGANGA